MKLGILQLSLSNWQYQEKEMELEVSKNWSKFKEERRTKCLNLADACLSWGIYDGIRLAWSNRVVGSF
jgi:hypothetical protein